jgi:hypothetical protein
MFSSTPDQARKPAALVSNQVRAMLYPLESSGKYYGLLKRAGKQFRRSLNSLAQR